MALNLQLKWPERARLAHRLLVIEASLGEMRTFSSDFADQSFLDSFRYALSTRAEPDEAAPEGVERLRIFIEGTRNGLNHGKPLDREGLPARRFRDQLDNDFEAMCRACSGVESSEEALCVAPLQRIFDEMLRLANESYRRRPIRARLTTAHSRLPQSTLGLNIDIVTLDGDEGGRHVRLDIQADSFDEQDYFACAYVLFHELFCHAGCGLLPTTMERSEPFADGWMDWVAKETLKRHAAAGAINAPLRSRASQFAQQAEAVSSRRYRSAPGVADLAARLRQGRAAAMRLHTLFAAMTGRQEKAWHAFHDFSVELNASHASDEWRGKLVLGCVALLDEGLTPAELLAETPDGLYDAIGAFLQSRSRDRAFSLCDKILVISGI